MPLCAAPPAASPGDYPPVVLAANAALQERDRKQVCKNILAFIRK